MDILQLLNDGKFHSGEELGSALGISRAAVWKQLSHWRQRGVEFDSVRGKGYRLLKSYEPLSESVIRANISAHSQKYISALYVRDKVDSTNDAVMQEMQANTQSAVICLAEEQTSGRGRRGREWISLPVSNFYGSIGWRFAEGIAVVEGLSLAVGVAIVRALSRLGISNIGLKWPNDVMWQNAKLGGVLIDLQAESDGPSTVVVGIGLNLRTVPGLAEQLGRPIAALEQCTSMPINRNQLAGVLLDELLLLLQDYASKGFSAYQTAWQQCDVLFGEMVEVVGASRELRGIARGVDLQGVLQIETDQGMERIYGGEVSLRKEGN